MPTPFSGIMTPLSMSFTTPDGKVHNVQSDHKNFVAIKETIKRLKRALVDDDKETVDAEHYALIGLVDASEVIRAAGAAHKVTVENGVVKYDGEAIHTTLTARILWGIEEGFDMGSYIRLLESLMENPSNRAVDELYGFIEHNSMGIMDDGRILAYKRVRDDFKDIYTGRWDNTPGQIVKMPRNRVDDDKTRTCSHGLHVCSQSYLPHYGVGSGNTIVVVAIWPRDFVSIPTDYRNAKARVCEYEVLAEYEGNDYDDLLSTKAVWSCDDFDDADPDFDDDYDYDYGEGEGEGDYSADDGYDESGTTTASDSEDDRDQQPDGQSSSIEPDQQSVADDQSSSPTVEAALAGVMRLLADKLDGKE